MAEEYEVIIKNDFYDVVPRLKGKSAVSSKWLFKIKHGVDGNIEKYKARFMARGSPRKRENIMTICLRLWLNIQPFVQYFLLLQFKDGPFIRWT